MDRRILKGLGWSALAGMVALSGCDLGDTVEVPTQPGVVPGAKAPILSSEDWDEGYRGEISEDSADWFRVELKKDSMYSITVDLDATYGGGKADVKVEVYGSLTYQVWAQDGADGGPKSARVVFASPLTGPVRVRVSHPGTVGWGRYLAVVAREDLYERDDIRAAANWIKVVDPVQRHSISDLDTDWVAFETVSGKYYELFSDRQGLDIQTYDEDGRVLLNTYGIESSGNGRNWGLKGTGGTVYAKVTKESTSSLAGVYTLGVRRTDDDSREPDDSAQIAARIGFGTNYEGVLLPFTEDWLQFAGAKDQGYKVKILSNEPLDVAVVDSVGYVHGTRTATTSAEFRFAPWTVQPVYIKVFNSTQVASYSLTVSKFDTTIVHSTVAEEGDKQGPI